MKELTVISGKGGTGKTSIVGVFASLAESAVIADCDVDAADLHLILQPEVVEEHEFRSGLVAVINPSLCNDCGDCRELCRFDAIDEQYTVDPIKCEGCGVCADNCPVEAISMVPDKAGRWFVSETRFGPMVHAKLGIGQENSGRLVSIVRSKAKEIGEARGLALGIVDGSPGIGCPVISSITGTDLVVVVTEPTQSGLHDMERVLELAKHFRVKAAVCVNKYDLNPDVAQQIERLCENKRLAFLGAIPYDSAVTEAMVAGKTVAEYGGAAAAALEKVFDGACEILQIERAPLGRNPQTEASREAVPGNGTAPAGSSAAEPADGERALRGLSGSRRREGRK